MEVTENQNFGEMPAMQIGRSPEEEDTVDLVEFFLYIMGSGVENLSLPGAGGGSVVWVDAFLCDTLVHGRLQYLYRFSVQ